MENYNQIQLYSSGLKFSAFESGKGQTVLLLHGFPDNNRTFRHQIPILNKSGYRTISPLLRGYEPSSCAKSYFIIDMAKDVLSWIDQLNLDKVHIVGHDWGAAIVYAACILAPEKFYSATTIAVPYLKHIFQGLTTYPNQFLNSWYIVFFQLYGLPEWVIQLNRFAFIEKLWKDWSPNYNFEKEEMEIIKQTLNSPGVLKATLSYYRFLPDFFSSVGRENFNLFKNSKIYVPLMAISGENDGCMDSRLYDTTMKEEDFPMGLKIEKIACAGHFAHLEKPDEINTLVLNWIKSQ